jgi:hypothetical protein
MDIFIGVLLGLGICYVLYKIVSKKETAVEVVVDKAGEEIKANIDAKTEEAFVKAMEESAKVINVPKESAELLDKLQETIIAETAKVAEPVVEEVKKKTRTVKAKAKAIEAVVEAKVEKLEEAVVKKTRTKVKKNG